MELSSNVERCEKNGGDWHFYGRIPFCLRTVFTCYS